MKVLSKSKKDAYNKNKKGVFSKLLINSLPKKTLIQFHFRFLRHPQADNTSLVGGIIISSISISRIIIISNNNNYNYPVLYERRIILPSNCVDDIDGQFCCSAFFSTMNGL